MELRVWRALAVRAARLRLPAATRDRIVTTGTTWTEGCRARMDAARRCFHYRGDIISSISGKHFLVAVELEATSAALRQLERR